ncbi:MAG TPA: BTAD domain-containing putative transcriptional regulator, partial [Solirubrobacteraceae bacterium]|nr:BTAD domain-containing putative transcriptional regulator [Solirubrobacteraceae bacterium]
MSVGDLIDALWEENLPEAPRNALQHHIARLRAVLGPESILGYPDGYALPDAAVDALRFEALLANARLSLREGDPHAGAESIALALELWRGPALQGLADTAWLRSEAQRLEALRVDALEEQFEAALALGKHRETASELRTAVEANPFRERLWGQLMLALYRSGRQADALEVFQEARGVLADELGLAPGPELRGIQQAILAHDPVIAPVPAPPRRRGNLPASSTSFIDREVELAQSVELLNQHRLVTLTGPPGTGKTRLALEVARSLEGELPDGAWVVEVARAEGAADVAGLVAQALDARGRDPLAQVVARLREADAVLVLDACEHALGEVAEIVSTLLNDCSRVRVLATSREILHVRPEVRLALSPLPLPEPGSRDVGASPAVQLFTARAQAARPGFELNDDAAPLAAEIARRTDGLPLAIELAAARLGVLGLAELLSVVEHRVSLAHSRHPSDPMRTALEELVEWSYDLLHADEKRLLQQICVHRGGATRPSLLALSADQGMDEATATYLLGALVDKSIVSVSFPGEAARYDVLDSVREYVLNRLTESGGIGVARQAHARYFSALAEEAQRGVCGAAWRDWLGRLKLDHDNLWAALTYAREEPDPDLAIRLGASLGFYFSLAERVSEGRRFLELALDGAADDAPVTQRVELLTYLCFLATEELDLSAALEAGERALELTATTGPAACRAHAQAFLAIALAQSGQGDRAARLAAEARETSEAGGDHWGAAVASIVGAEGAAVAGDLPAVAALAGSAARHSEEIDYLVGLVPATFLQAWVAERRG